MPVDVRLHAGPGQPAALAAAAEPPDPANDDVVPERGQRSGVRRHRKVREVPAENRAEPPALLVDAGVHVSAQFRFDLTELGFQPPSGRLPEKLETGTVLLPATDVREPQEVERLRFAQAPPGSVCGGIPTELEPGLSHFAEDVVGDLV